MKYRALVYVLISSLLCSCVAVVVAGAAAGMIVYDRRTLKTMESDARIFHLIHKALVEDARFRGSHIEVISFNQVVLLVGQTTSPSLRVAAEKIAQNTPAVRRVYNELTIGLPLSLKQKTQDTFITGQVRSYMLGRKDLESGSIRVVTENATVYLMGTVTHEQAYLAVDVARHVTDVRKVVKVFRYIT
ncbi:21 kDa hemolysin precursor [Legionella beliardensis]|uniref:21 kDa hemolysin n=1 Tax=Legionella beliardensis TaxID=91822 RepID=A0A378I671_9GAMM|nr:BON domain-containing protein [Legionella beliardensis]STX30236.1 21 kDa hemolysin precursor [Legionella beliardensis]